MSLAENLLNSLDGTSYQNAALSDQEEHIKVGQDRVITVPNALKNIAVKGDKDIETVTFDCVRYWDGHDLSTFAIYINYILPNGDEGTYIPESITRYEDVFSFDWEIGSEITYVPGKLTFWIVTKLTDDSGVLIKQWSSFQNSDCTIAQGGDKTYVPSQTDQDVISQAISISRASAERAEEQANIATEAAEKAASDAKAAAEEEVTRLVGELGVVQGTGISPTSVISQAGATRSFAHALNGKESGGAVLCEDVSPVLHPVVVGVRSGNLIPFPFEITDFTLNGISVSANSSQKIIINGDCTGDTQAVIARFTLPIGTYTLNAIQPNAYTRVLLVKNGYLVFSYANVDSPYTFNVEYATDEYRIDFLALNGGAFSNSIYAVMLSPGTSAEPFSPFVPNGTAVKVGSCGLNLFNTRLVSDSDSITITTPQGSSAISSGKKLKEFAPSLKIGDSVTLSAKTTGTDKYIYLEGANVLWSFGGSLTVTDAVLNSTVLWYASGINTTATISEVMLNKGLTALPHTPYIAGQSIDTTVGSTIDLPSIAPYMSVYTDTEGTAVDVTYVKDTNAVVQKLVNAIVALGGNV